MLLAHRPTELRAILQEWRQAGLSIGFVPTMGALHEGHLSLVRQAGEAADRVVASIFVNPKQFNQAADLERYPRMPERDAELLAGAGCHLLFLPEVGALYPRGFVTQVEVAGPPAEGLEGAYRPGHFRGVATVVTLLFNLVAPDVAVFGEKDAQQLALVRRLVVDLQLPVEILAGATVREADGLAMSSRNLNLSPEARRAAPVLYRALCEARRAIEAGERSGERVRERLREVLSSEPLARVDYAEVVHADTFQPAQELSGRLVLPLAVEIGGVRLIDNLSLEISG
ncbi:MAG TPA: pantoate--beta-alanine ligase [Thermoanaerobaculia bacterium]|mgnify:CR=1 FL=1|nr:pantoate--beta-alanine ligase [Thermoanaerobaculia bacterium]